MIRSAAILVACLILSYPTGSLAQMMKPVARLEMKIDGRAQKTMKPGAVAEWEFEYYRVSSNEKFTRFMRMHAKPMHMVVVKDDLSEFAHVHPYHDIKTGSFFFSVNDEPKDPDNFMQSRVVPTEGRYFVFTEVMPMGEGAMAMNRAEVKTTKAYRAQPVALNPDVSVDEKKVSKYFNEFSEEVNEMDARYRVDFWYELFPWCDFWLPKFYMKVHVRNEFGGFEPVQEFQDWLEMGGHAVIVGADGKMLRDRVFYHLHAFKPMAHPGKFIFPYHDHFKGMPHGTYKIWGQFKHEDRVLTIPFAFDYKPEAPDNPSGNEPFSGCP